jgi:cyclophilin family peptidyl-prolyl cis-trans isomerase/HEAT repeat protein
VALPVLLQAGASDPDYFVRENCASALGRVARPAALQALLKATQDPDHRVRIAALRALPTSPITVVSATRRPGKAANEVILQVKTRPADSLRVRCAGRALGARLPQESLTAAEWFLKTPHDTATADNVMDWLRYVVGIEYSATAARHWRTRATLLQAALRHARAEQRPAITDTIRRRYAGTANQYERAALLTALAEDPAQFDFLAKEAALTAGPPVVPGSALAALVSLRGNKNFTAARQADFTAALRRALAGGDVAQLATAAEALASPTLAPAPQPEDLAALRQAQAKLTLPREIEAWLGLQQALDKLEKKPTPTPAPVGPASQHPIDWALVQTIPVGQRVQMTTTKGTILLELKVVEAPGSVASFVSLIKQHFYDGLYFHRVVPDFVAQGGDPRGDGSGSTPYNLRSEFSQLTYGAGAVGLASAGKDTESCQFFFTHQPTPHLDGRYTIFAQVVQGLAVVQQLEIGDKMLRVELLKPAR